MKAIEEHDIIKVNKKILHVLKASNNGSYLCKNSKGCVVWADYTQKPVNPGFLQLSCMEIKDGRMIPTSDRQYSITDGFREFFRDLPGVTNINYLEQ